MRSLLLLVMITAYMSLSSQTINISVENEPAENVFKEIMRQSDKNFVFKSNLLKNKSISAHIKNASLSEALDKTLTPIGIGYTLKDGVVVLHRMSPRTAAALERHTISGFVRDSISKEAIIGAIVRDLNTNTAVSTNSNGFYSLTASGPNACIAVNALGYIPRKRNIESFKSDCEIDFSMIEAYQIDEVTVIGDKNMVNMFESASIGHTTINSNSIKSTPVVFGESDIIKTIQLQPGVSAGVEGLASMYVHGGNHDENLYLRDNIPLYQINHFGGLFSAFNTEAVKNVDFYKSSFPAKYNGRLSSVMEVNTKDGNMTKHNGSLKLGLTSGAFNIDGPIIKDRTTYSFAMRRSWFDVLSVPALAIYNSLRNDDTETTVARYAFTDINGKITHHFNKKSRLHLMAYYGEDFLKGGTKSDYEKDKDVMEYHESDITRIRWGNFIVSTGWNYLFNPKFTGNLTAAYSRYNSTLRREQKETSYDDEENDKVTDELYYDSQSHNSISDWIFRSDFDYMPNAMHRVNFGANYTYHRFMPEMTSMKLDSNEDFLTRNYSKSKSIANEINAYISDDWKISQNVRSDIGLNISSFFITNKSHVNFNPRAAINWKVTPKLNLKASYARMSQYVHQLTESSLSLPTDQWIPIAGDLKPQTSDNYAIGAYYNLSKSYVLSAEAYYRNMRNIVDYRDDYYMVPADAPFYDQLTSGRGTAKGIDLIARKNIGKITGHISYSLLWSDRKFAEKNHGMKFPSKFDNRHKINILINWRINDKWEVNASWTGMSGNMFTFSTQDYDILPDDKLPPFGDNYYDGYLDFIDGINNYRLPFYHRLDLGANRHTHNGMWTFSLYNAYCNMNTIALRKTFEFDGYGTTKIFQRLHLIPIIPSVSYTWFF